VKNLSKGIISTKKDNIALKASKKSKKKLIIVESSSEEEQDEDDEDEEKEYDEEEMALFINKFNKYMNKRRPLKGDKEKTRSKRVCYNCGKNGHFIAQCPYERKYEDDDKKKKKEKGYKKDKKFLKTKFYGQAHIGQEWDSSNESSESKSDDLATIAIKGESSSNKSSPTSLSTHVSLQRETRRRDKPMHHTLLSMSLVMKILFLVMMMLLLVMTMNLSQMNFAKILIL
jgi:hypothetical protein